MSRLHLFSCAAISFAISLGCEEDPPPAAPEGQEASAEKKPAVDEKIANAMAAAQASSEASAPSASQLSPPADGIMSADVAARELPAGSPAVLVVGSEGGTPKLRLGPERLAPGAGPTGKLQLSYRSGGSVMPTIQAELKPKVTLAAATASASSPGVPPSDAGAMAVRFSLSNVRPAADQPGRLPDKAAAELAKMNGSWVELLSTASGARTAERAELAGNNPGLEPLLSGSAEALSSIVLPYPEVPVGVGAFWMVKSREKSNGAAVLAYRMVKLTELTEQGATLSVSTRRYLLTPTLPLEGLPPHRVRQFESQGNATLRVRAGSAYPESAELQDSFGALLAPSERPNQAMPFRSELEAKLSFAL